MLDLWNLVGRFMVKGCIRMSVEFKLEKKPNRNGTLVDTLVKYETDKEPEDWTTIEELDRLFEACVRRWNENGWDLEKLITCVNECEFD